MKRLMIPFVLAALAIAAVSNIWVMADPQSPNSAPKLVKPTQSPQKPPAAPEGHLANSADRAREALESKAKALQAKIAAATAATFGETADAAMSALEQQGGSVERQIEVVDAVTRWAAELRGALDEVKRSNLAESRDLLVKIYSELASDLEREASRHDEKSKAAGEEFKANYARLADACRKLSRGYRANGEYFAKVDLAGQLVKAQAASEWLGDVQETLVHIRTALGRIEGDAATLEQLKDIHAGVARLQTTISRFAGIVEDAGFSRHTTPPSKTPASTKE